MRKIGIDVGSTYTKYCILDESGIIESLYSEKTPIRQKIYFDQKIKDFREAYGELIEVVSCGYGKSNVEGIQQINELTALARGAYYMCPEEAFVIDIGGQDTKIIRHENGRLKEFFLNDKCAAGSGMFLISVAQMLEKNLDDIVLVPFEDMNIRLSSRCAVFAQSEIVKLVADNVTADEILSAVVFQILVQTKNILGKVNCHKAVISGGLVEIKNIQSYIEQILEIQCVIAKEHRFLSAVGCVVKDNKALN